MAISPSTLPFSPPASTAPQTSWSPQQQTARMLALCEAQMDAATEDADAAVEMLAQAFTDLVGTARKLQTVTAQIAATGSDINSLREVHERCSALSRQATAAVVAFQFYDKLSQRLGHVRYSLSTLALFLCDPPNSQKPEHWDKLLTTLGRLYRTAEERAVFDAVAGTLSLAVPESENVAKGADSRNGSVELF